MTTAPRADREGREWDASVNGTRLRVEELGTGSPSVVFSPALFTNRALFDAPVADLSRDHRCIRYDHRGQGDSGLGDPRPSPGHLSTEGLYEDAVALLDQLGVDSLHWVGASIGGFVGVRLAVRQPRRVRSLTLIGFSIGPLSRAEMRQVDLLSMAVRASGALGRMGAPMRRRVNEQVMRNMFGATFMSDPARADDRETWRERFLVQMVPAAVPMLREVFGHPGNPPELLARVEVPTLIIAGEDEVGDDPQVALQAIQDARLVTIAGAGHMVLVEQPDVGTAAITEFIRDVDAA